MSAGGKRILGLMVALALAAGSLAAADGGEELFRLSGVGSAELVEGAVVAAQRVQVDPTVVESAAPVLAFPLFDGLIHTARLSSHELRGPGDATWRGYLAEGGRVVLTLKSGYVIGAVYAPGGVHEITTARDGGQVLALVDTELLPPCAGGVASRDDVPPGLRPPAAELPAASPPEGALTTMDVMGMYTPQARDAAGGVDAIAATVQAAVDMANTGFFDSDVAARFRLVHTALANRNDSGDMQADLLWLQSDPGVAALRDEWGADMVGMLVNSGGFCGIGFVMRNPGPGFAGSAFQVTARTCAVGNLSYAHEHGHNMGCEHDPANGAPPGSASYLWSFGHYVDGSYRTIMSYSGPCTMGCTRVAHWSNPGVNHNGVPTGIADQRDNHRTIDLTAPVVAAFRDEVVIFNDGFESGNVSAWSAQAP